MSGKSYRGLLGGCTLIAVMVRQTDIYPNQIVCCVLSTVLALLGAEVEGNTGLAFEGWEKSVETAHHTEHLCSVARARDTGTTGGFRVGKLLPES